MKIVKMLKKALKGINYDLFKPENITPPAPATIDHKIRQATEQYQIRAIEAAKTIPNRKLPTVLELYQMFDRFNLLHFDGKLPRVTIEYSNRMTSAGSYTPKHKVIKISRKYHHIFPEDIEDTLKHEMIHIIHFKHNKAFKDLAKKIGASVRAKSHPSLRRPPRYIYTCPQCKMEYPRQKRLVMASCGKCSTGKRFDKRFKLQLVQSKAINKK
jgi:predicted SprT family Zn-dependent metalloprotease